MLLTVDIGNTQTAIGLFSQDDLVAHWRFATRHTDTADEVHLNLAGQLDLAGYSADDVERFVIASVVPTLTSVWTDAARRISGRAPITVGPGIKTGLPMRYDNPAEVGADRVADALAAIDLVGAPAIVVDLGTATNIEVIDREGNFRGGIIAPGLGTSADALSSHAARLPQTELSFPEHAIGTNTNDAMRSGLMWGEVARIDGLVQRVFDELGYTTPVIATGGFAGIISKHSCTVTHHERNLTLHGLKLIYERNK